MGYPKSQEEISKGSPSASKSTRFPKDQFLRSRGWTIHARPKGKPAKWRYKNQLIVTESEALEFEQYEKVAKRQKVTKDGE